MNTLGKNVKLFARKGTPIRDKIKSYTKDFIVALLVYSVIHVGILVFVVMVAKN